MVSLNSLKGGPQVSATYGDEAAQGGHFVPAKYRGTVKDQADMSALGREQVLRVCLLLALIELAVCRLLYGRGISGLSLLSVLVAH